MNNHQVLNPVIIAKKVTLKTGTKPKYSEVFTLASPSVSSYLIVKNKTTSAIKVYLDDNISSAFTETIEDPSPTAVATLAVAKVMCDCVGIDGAFTLRVECDTDLAADGDVVVYLRNI